MRYSAEHKSQSRNKVLMAAAKAIRQQGTAAVSVAAVMSDAGMTHGGFYAHFSSREALIAESVTCMFDEQREKARAMLSAADPVKGITAWLEMYLSLSHVQHPERGCPLPLLSGEIARLSDDARLRFNQGRKAMVDIIAEPLDRLGCPDPVKQSQSLIAEILGAVSLARLAQDDNEALDILSASKASLYRRLGLIPGR